MKSELITNTPEIDWDKPQLVISSSGTVVLTSGNYNSMKFKGTVVNVPKYLSDEIKLGWFSESWVKSSFWPLPYDGQVILKND